MDLHFELECGCAVHVDNETLKIEYCPLHYAADEALAIIKDAHYQLADIFRVRSGCDELLERMENYIAKAEPFQDVKVHPNTLTWSRRNISRLSKKPKGLPMRCRLYFVDDGSPVPMGRDRYKSFRKRCKTPEEAAAYSAKAVTRYLSIFGGRKVEWRVIDERPID